MESSGWDGNKVSTCCFVDMCDCVVYLNGGLVGMNVFGRVTILNGDMY